MGRTACAEPQCLYKFALYLFYLTHYSGYVCWFNREFLQNGYWKASLKYVKAF